MPLGAYRKSDVLQAWLTDRRDELRAIEEVHRRVIRASTDGDRPLQRGGDQIADAFIVRMYAEFQGFVRDLHDLAIIAFVRGSQVPLAHRPPVISAATQGRRIDQGNAGLDAISTDFRRIGLTTLRASLDVHNPRLISDRRRYEELTQLRNALAHGNAEQLRGLIADGIKPTMTWGRAALPALNRMARALDRCVWDHVSSRYPNIDPWGAP